ncbi:MAG: zinc ribbon domain-containing protein [Lactobacillus delbrueckii]|nr:zinc ribbon domain-containing protein [Lactobacillus delbrueckii]
MKICPNCGSSMDEETNFCTKCGTDLRNVATSVQRSEVAPEANVAVQQAPVQESAAPTQAAENVQERPATTRAEAKQQSITASQLTNVAANQLSNAANYAKENFNFDAANMWQWFVNSWKHPFADQEAERWYGWVTLLVEDFLLGLGLYIFEQRAARGFDSTWNSNVANSTSGATFSVVFEMIIFLALTELCWIFACFISYKVIYNKKRDLLDLTNHIVQTSNLNAIFVVIYFFSMMFTSTTGGVLPILMLVLIELFFSKAITVSLLGDNGEAHDKFYGYILFLVIQGITTLILIMVIGSSVLSQIKSYLGSSFWSMFN